MTTTSTTFASRATTANKKSPQDNLFVRIEQLQSYLETVQTDLFKLDEQAKSIQEEKKNVENYLEERAENTKNKLMQELGKFEGEVRDKIDSAKR